MYVNRIPEIQHRNEYTIPERTNYYELKDKNLNISEIADKKICWALLQVSTGIDWVTNSYEKTSIFLR